MLWRTPVVIPLPETWEGLNGYDTLEDRLKQDTRFSFKRTNPDRGVVDQVRVSFYGTQAVQIPLRCTAAEDATQNFSTYRCRSISMYLVFWRASATSISGADRSCAKEKYDLSGLYEEKMEMLLIEITAAEFRSGTSGTTTGVEKAMVVYSSSRKNLYWF